MTLIEHVGLSVLHQHTQTHWSILVSKPVKWSCIVQEAFVSKIYDNLNVNLNDVNDFARNIAEVLYECSQSIV